MKEVVAVIISIIFVFAVIFVSELIRKVKGFSTEFTRKFVHIGVSHWWFVAMFLIKDLWYALIPPVLFVAVNYYSHKTNLIKSMERETKNSNLGTVYFPIALILLLCLTWEQGILGGDYKYIGAVGIMILGYGDGFAAIIGENFGRYNYSIMGNTKSLEGSITMFLFSFLASAVILVSYLGYDVIYIRAGFIVAVAATLIEAITPLGMDNITVPVMSAILLHYLLNVLDCAQLFMLIYMASVGFIISFLIAYGAYLKKSLTIDGSIGATFMGTVIHATSGVYGILMMLLFFFSASFLSHFKKNLKERVAKRFQKTGKRDAFQVLANGGIALIYSIMYHATKDNSFLVLMGIAFAAANADTWATELGILNRKDPISLRTFKRVEKGTSGAVSLFGTTAALMGAMFIAIFVTFGFSLVGIKGFHLDYVQCFLFVTLGGFVGSLIDSILGATIQGVYYSEELKGETEKSIYNGKPTLLVRGFRFVNNDIVNFLSIGISSLLFVSLI